MLLILIIGTSFIIKEKFFTRPISLIRTEILWMISNYFNWRAESSKDLKILRFSNMHVVFRPR